MSTIYFIDADQQGGLEHADGVVALTEPNVAVINTYEDDPHSAADLGADVEAGLPGVTGDNVALLLDHLQW